LDESAGSPGLQSLILYQPNNRAGKSAYWKDNTMDWVMRVDSEPNRFPLEGIIVEWDPFFWRTFNRRFGLGEEDWTRIRALVKAMNVHQTRTMVLPSFHEPLNDDTDPESPTLEGFQFDTDAMVSLVRQLDLCEEEGIDVTLSYHGVPPDHWLAYPGMQGWSGPSNVEEFGKNVAALLKYLLFEKKYNCVKNLNLFNEPNIAYGTPDTDFSVNQWTKGEPEKREYVRMVRAVHEHLVREGIRSRIRLVVCDESEQIPYMRDVTAQLADIGDIVSSHNYQFTAASTKEEIRRWACELMDAARKAAPDLPHVLYEIGNKNILDPYHVTDADEFERGFYLPCVVLSYLNEGGTGASYWILFDQLYGDRERCEAMNMGLFGYKDEDWKLRPTYHAWALLSRFTAPGARIHPVTSENEDLIATVLANPDRSHAFLVVNRSLQPLDIVLKDDMFADGVMEYYEYTEVTCRIQSDRLPSSGTAVRAGHILRGTLAPRSLTVFHGR
jgi:hypothetical protein